MKINNASCCHIISDVWIEVAPWAVFHYEKINSYLIYICCEDHDASAKSLLQVDIQNETPERKYRHPGTYIIFWS